jgi:hypothetical protein
MSGAVIITPYLLLLSIKTSHRQFCGIYMISIFSHLHILTPRLNPILHSTRTYFSHPLQPLSGVGRSSLALAAGLCMGELLNYFNLLLLPVYYHLSITLAIQLHVKKTALDLS